MANNDERNEGLIARFDEIREVLFNGFNRAFAEKTGIHPNTMSGMCNGSSPIGITNILKVLNNIPEINARWLMTGEGKMLNEGAVVDSYNPKHKVHSNGHSNIGDIQGPQVFGDLLERGAKKNTGAMADERAMAFIQELADTINKQTDTINKQTEIINKQTDQITNLLSLLGKQE